MHEKQYEAHPTANEISKNKIRIKNQLHKIIQNKK